MPQMSPMLWLILFFMFLTIFLFFNILNYFNFLINKTFKNNKQEEAFNSTQNLNWKW